MVTVLRSFWHGTRGTGWTELARCFHTDVFFLSSSGSKLTPWTGIERTGVRGKTTYKQREKPTLWPQAVLSQAKCSLCFQGLHTGFRTLVKQMGFQSDHSDNTDQWEIRGPGADLLGQEWTISSMRALVKAPEQARRISSRMLGVSVFLAPHLVPFADVPGDSLRQAGTPRSHGLFWLLRPLGECNESLGHCLQVKKQS